MGARCSAAPAAPVSEPVPPSAGTTEAVNRLGLELLASFLGQHQSLFVSPLSVATCLAMVLHGARGETELGMLAALGVSSVGSAQFVKEAGGSAGFLHSRDPRVAFLLANSVWSETLLDDYVASLRSLFSAEAHSVPPRKDPINAWCKKKTKGMIPQVLEDEPDPTGAVLVNALYFKGAWKKKFDKKLTRPATFMGLLGGAKECQMMTAAADAGKFLYAETNTYQVAALPYGDGGAYSAVVLLPRRGSEQTLMMGGASQPRAASVQEVLGDVGSGGAMGLPELKPTKGSLSFPRFRSAFWNSLRGELGRRGMGAAFTLQADFSGMSPGLLELQDVIHRTVVEVSEDGTTAAAVTAAVLARSLRLEPTFAMTCDRPFLFLLRHDPTELLLFAGVVGDV